MKIRIKSTESFFNNPKIEFGKNSPFIDKFDRRILDVISKNEEKVLFRDGRFPNIVFTNEIEEFIEWTILI